MTQDKFDLYLPGSLSRLSSELAKSLGVPTTESRVLAEKSFRNLFPEGKMDSSDQYVFEIISNDDSVGILHFGIRRERDTPYAFVWDLEVYPQHRKKGLGAQAMLCVES